MNSFYQVGSPLLGALSLKNENIRDQTYQRFAFNNGNFAIKINEIKTNPSRSYISFFNHHSSEPLLLELGFLANTIKREYGCPITCFIRYLEYCRSNRIKEKSTSFGAKVYIDLLCSLDIDRFIVFDLHAPELIGFFSQPVQQISTIPLFAKQFLGDKIGIDYVISPDCGRIDACSELANQIGAQIDFLPKIRTDHSGESKILVPHRSHLQGKKILLFDDEITSGQTLRNAVECLIKNGVADIHIAVVYFFGSEEFLESLERYPEVRSLSTTNLGMPVISNKKRSFHFKVFDCSHLYQFE